MNRSTLKTIVVSTILLTTAALHTESRDCTGMSMARISQTFQQMKDPSLDAVIRVTNCDPEIIRGSSNEIKKIVSQIAVGLNLGQFKQPMVQHIDSKHISYVFATVGDYGSLCGRIINSTNSMLIYISGYDIYDPYQIAESLRRIVHGGKAQVEISIRS